jgi:hypothetical protein
MTKLKQKPAPGAEISGNDRHRFNSVFSTECGFSKGLERLANVRFGSKADIGVRLRNVRFTPKKQKSARAELVDGRSRVPIVAKYQECLLLNQSGHERRTGQWLLANGGSIKPAGMSEFEPCLCPNSAG